MFKVILIFTTLLECNYPQHTVIVDENYDRTPSKNKSIGVMDVLDEIYVSFDVVIHSWPTTLSNVLHIGNQDSADTHARFPAIFIRNDEILRFSLTQIVDDDMWYDHNVSLQTLYHLTFHQTQEYVTITVNDVSLLSKRLIPSHPVMFYTNIYVSNPWYDAADATISNLFISTSTTQSPHMFNYLCDAENRLNITQGSWLFNTTRCTVESTDESSRWSAIWFGDYDTYSMLWTDCILEVDILFTLETKHNEQIDILFRTQSAIRDNREGYFLSMIADEGVVNQTRFGKFTGGPISIISMTSLFKWEFNTIYTIRIEMAQSHFSFYRNDEFLFESVDETFISGSIGIRTYFATAAFHSLYIDFVSYNNHLLYSSNPSYGPTADPTNEPTAAPTFVPLNPSNDPIINTLEPSIAPMTNSVAFVSTNIDNKNSGQRIRLFGKSLDITVVIAIAIGLLIALCIIIIAVNVFVVKLYCKKKQEPQAKEMARYIPKVSSSVPLSTEPNAILSSTIVLQEAEGEQSAADAEMVETWLKNTVGLPQYLDGFIKNGFDSLKAIGYIKNQQTLIDIGISDECDANVVMLEIRELQKWTDLRTGSGPIADKLTAEGDREQLEDIYLKKAKSNSEDMYDDNLRISVNTSTMTTIS